MSATAVRDAAEYESRLQQYYFERAEEARAVRVGEKEVSEQAAIVARYRDLFTRPQIEALREAESGRERRGPRAALPAAQDVRGRRHLGGDRGAGGRARERDPRRARDVPRRGDAVARCAGDGSRCSTRTPTAKSSASSSVRRRPRSTPTGARCSRRASCSRPTSAASPIRLRATRRRRRSPCASSSACSLPRRMRRRTRGAGFATPGSRSCSAPNATSSPRMRTSTTSGGCRRSSRRTRRTLRSTSAWRRRSRSGST